MIHAESYVALAFFTLGRPMMLACCPSLFGGIITQCLCFKGLLKWREGHPSKWVNPSWRAKDSPGVQAKCHR